MEVETRPLLASDGDWVRQQLTDHWGDSMVASRGRLHRADRLPGFVAERDGERVGLLTFTVDGDQCEIVTIHSLQERHGIGTALLQAATVAARSAGCRRLWLITTNDNTPAMGFYRRYGFALAAVHQGAIAESRRLKPQIPEIGLGGVPIRDEIEFELPLVPVGNVLEIGAGAEFRDLPFDVSKHVEALKSFDALDLSPQARTAALRARDLVVTRVPDCRFCIGVADSRRASDEAEPNGPVIAYETIHEADNPEDAETVRSEVERYFLRHFPGRILRRPTDSLEQVGTHVFAGCHVATVG